MKRPFRHNVDSEGYVHISGPALNVNTGLCGNNDAVEESDEPVTCKSCLEVVRYVCAHRVPA